MQVVLKTKIPGLGEMGDVIAVAPGYAQNFLIPQKKAVLANKGNVAWAEKLQAERIAKKQEIIKNAQKYADDLAKLKLVFSRKTTADGHKLFGAVAEKDLIAKIEKEAKIHLEKKQIEMKHHLKETGEYTIKIHLAEDIYTDVKVVIEPEKE
jgi:large subunit ribosomal protein L9